MQVPMQQALASSHRRRFLGITGDDAIKCFFGGNAFIAIVVLFLICFSLGREAFDFPSQNLENLSDYRKAGLEYVDYLREQVDGFMVMSRFLNDIRLQQFKKLQAEGKSDNEVQTLLQPFDAFKDKFDGLISPHQSILSDWTTEVSDLKDRLKANEDALVSKRTLLNAGMKEQADAVEVAQVDFVKETATLRQSFPQYQELNQTLRGSLQELVGSLPTLPSSNLGVKLDRFKIWVSEYTATFPIVEAKMQAWDPSRPIPFYKSITAFLFGAQWVTASFWQDWYGLLPLLMGSICISFVALMIAVPFGLCAAIYVNQIAKPLEQGIIKPYIEFISAIPSVVLGFFGIAVLGRVIVVCSHWAIFSWVPGFPVDGGLTIFTAGCLLAFMSVPTIFTLAEDALNNVPRSYIEASTALGSTKLQTISKIMVPAALSGIISAILLGLGRVIGETMVVLLCAGNRIQIPDFTKGISAIFQPAHTMTGIIAQEMGEVVTGSTQYRALFMVGVMLFLISLLINYLAQLVVKKYKISIG